MAYVESSTRLGLLYMSWGNFTPSTAGRSFLKARLHTIKAVLVATLGS